VNSYDPLDALQFNDQKVIDDQINSVARIDFYPVINNGKRELALN